MAGALVFKQGGNWLEGERYISDQDREATAKWAQSYMQALFNIDATGQPHPDMSQLPNQYDASICRGEYKPKDTNQYMAIMLAANWGRAALFADMGAGKTFMGGYSAMYWKKHSPCFRGPHNMVTLVVCPKNVIGEWESQPLEFFGTRVSVFPENVDWFNSDIVVTNYEQLSNVLQYKQFIGGVILDESHKAKNIYTATFANVAALGLGVWHRMVLTGTPLKNKPDDLFTQLSFINPYAFNFSYTFMMQNYFTAIKVVGRPEPSYKFKEKFAFLFHDIVRNNAFRMEAPARAAGSETIIQAFKPTAEQEKYIDMVREGTVLLLKGEEPDTNFLNAFNPKATHLMQVALKNKLIKLSQVSSGFMQAGDDTWRFTSNKMAACYKYVTEDWKDHQIIVWVYFKETVRRLEEAFSDAGVSVVSIMGGLSRSTRKQRMDAFKSGAARVAVAQISAMNAGENLQHCCHGIYTEWDWGPSTIDQAVARIDRPGQKNKCFHLFLYTEGTTDELHIESYKNKTKLSGNVVSKFVSRVLLKGVRVSVNTVRNNMRKKEEISAY